MSEHCLPGNGVSAWPTSLPGQACTLPKPFPWTCVTCNHVKGKNTFAGPWSKVEDGAADDSTQILGGQPRLLISVCRISRQNLACEEFCSADNGLNKVGVT